MAGNGDSTFFSVNNCSKPLVTTRLMNNAISIPTKTSREFVSIDISR